ESVHSQLAGDTIHILHQVTESALYHAFRTSDHPTHPDTWAIRDEPAGFVEAVAQTASMVVRSDGSIVAFYLGQEKIHYSIRSADGAWGQVMTLDPDLESNQAGPQAVLGENDVIHLAHYETDGTIWYRQLLPDGTLTPGQQLAAGAGTSRAEYGAVLPLLYNPQKDEVIIIYRLATGNLWERRAVKNVLTEATKITEHKVITDAVDSQQAGADAVLDGDIAYVLFIEESSRSINSTSDKGGWQPARLLVDDILGSWVRGNIYIRPDGVKVYGYIYDAGSDGGAGMNRFNELILVEN
ncbi:exo-alpha-sialidase, partial [candidate division KSB1 bacterium]|nr:exo-alpha-sialidase [candidate division KSB1 bacterium]